MANTLDRIKEFIDYKGLSVRKFEESMGFSNGSFASQLKNNKTIGVDKVENILHKYSDLNPTWLLTGEGKMLKSDADERPSAEPTIIYKSDPRDTEMIELQRFKIKELERQLSAAGVKSGFAQSVGLHSYGPPPKKR